MPGLRKAQQRREFAIAQFTSSSRTPALNTDAAAQPHCRATNDKVLSLAREINPDVVLLHSAWEQYLDGVAQTVAALTEKASAFLVGSIIGRVLGGPVAPPSNPSQ